jgi:hypothetical protein
MFKNVCDPNSSTLEWKPEIKAVLEREWILKTASAKA